MPLLGSRGAASAKGFGFTSAGVVLSPAWGAALYSSGSVANPYGIAIDSSGNVYITGNQSATDSSGAIELAKYNLAGTIQWQRALSTSGVSDVAYSVRVDGSGNPYIAGYTSENPAGGLSLLVAKYNTSGTLQWQKRANDSTGYDSYANGIAINSGGTALTAVGSYSWGGPNRGYLTFWTSGGTLSSQTTMYNDTGSGETSEGNAASYDSSGNVYCAGTLFGSGVFPYVWKFNSSYANVWQYTYGSGFGYFRAIATDSSANVYVVGDILVSSYNRLLVMKLDSSGAITWQKTLAGASYVYGKGVAVDTAGNVYAAGYFDDGGTYKGLVAKYNSSGVLQWQRSFSIGGAYTSIQSIQTNSAGSIFFVTNSTAINTNGAYVTMRISTTGGNTGTFTLASKSCTYAASSLTDGTPTYTRNTPYVSVSGTSRSFVTSTLTSSTSSLTTALTTL